MTNSVLRDTIILGLMATGLALAAAHKETIYEKIGLTVTPAISENPAPSQPASPSNSAMTTNTVQPLSGFSVSIPKSKTDGQFWTDARVNNGRIRFLVDTGASAVVLTPEDARKAGIRVNQLKFDVPIATANGDNVAAFVTLRSVSIGNVKVRNVKALIVPKGLTTSLLGMTFLGELKKVEVTPSALILKL